MRILLTKTFRGHRAGHEIDATERVAKQFIKAGAAICIDEVPVAVVEPETTAPAVTIGQPVEEPITEDIDLELDLELPADDEDDDEDDGGDDED